MHSVEPVSQAQESVSQSQVAIPWVSVQQGPLAQGGGSMPGIGQVPPSTPQPGATAQRSTNVVPSGQMGMHSSQPRGSAEVVQHASMHEPEMTPHSSGGPEWLEGQPPRAKASAARPLRCARVGRERMMVDEQQEPFRSRVPAIGLAVYALAVIAGGPAVVIAKRTAPEAESPLRVALALFALLGIGLLARERRGRSLIAVAAVAALTRAALAADLLDLGRLTGALVEGVEMASVALALATHLPPERTRSRSALRALALGAFALKLAWGFEQVSVVRYGGLALLPLALVALVAYVRGRRSATTY